MGAMGIQKCKDTGGHGAREHGDPGVQGHGDMGHGKMGTWMWGCGAWKEWGQGDPGIQRHRDTGILGHEDQEHKGGSSSGSLSVFWLRKQTGPW